MGGGLRGRLKKRQSGSRRVVDLSGTKNALEKRSQGRVREELCE